MSRHTLEHVVPTRDEDGKVTSVKLVADRNLSILIRPTKPGNYRVEKVPHA